MCHVKVEPAVLSYKLNNVFGRKQCVRHAEQKNLDWHKLDKVVKSENFRYDLVNRRVVFLARNSALHQRVCELSESTYSEELSESTYSEFSGHGIG